MGCRAFRLGLRILPAGEAVTAYYNEIDPFAAAWLENLIAANLIAPGVVDTRSIEDIRPDEIAEFTQCHFFAGIGLWSYALRLAGWPDHRPVWSGSCPCQPFSAAGKGDGFADERHLWPHWHWLIDKCRPVAIFGEQVASKDGLGWFDLVSADLEGSGYAIGANDLCAAGFGAPHIRQRLAFAASRLEHTEGDGRQQWGAFTNWRGTFGGCSPIGVADTDDSGSQGRNGRRDGTDQRAFGSSGMVGGVADANGGNTGAKRQQCGGEFGLFPQGAGIERMVDSIGGSVSQPGRRPDYRNGNATASAENHRTDARHNPWRNPDRILCRDNKFRPVEPGTFPLVNGYPGRVGVLRAYGNAIVPQVFAAFIEAAQEVMP